MRAVIFGAVLMFAAAATAGEPNSPQDKIGKNVQKYFDTVFAGLKAVADKKPTVDTFREAMAPFEGKTAGFYGGTLIDKNFVIVQVYYRTHFLAKGFDLKKVAELKDFWKQMKTDPKPQLSEPGHGSIMQPKLIAMRYPVLDADKKLVCIVSTMIRTENFLADSGLDKCTAYRITCLGKVAEENGVLSSKCRKVSLSLPSTTWVIEYDE